jgi:hypothetical protein
MKIEELQAICVGSGVRHRQDTGSGVLELEVLVLKLSSIDKLVSGSVVVGEVTTLHCTASCGANIGSDYWNIVIGL